MRGALLAALLGRACQSCQSWWLAWDREGGEVLGRCQVNWQVQVQAKCGWRAVTSLEKCN